MGKKKQKRYSEPFKKKVVSEVLAGKFTKEGARRHYGIGSNCAVLYWMRTYSGQRKCRIPTSLTKGPSIMQNRFSGHQKNKRIKELEDELYFEKQRADLWQAIVEIAEEELGLDIKKKFGARRSNGSKGKGPQR